MMTLIIFLVLLIAAIYGVIFLYREDTVDGYVIEGKEPEELLTGRLIAKEVDFLTDNPPIIARPDSVYLNAMSQGVVVETKSRKVAREYQSDIVQMSASRIAAQDHLQLPFAPYGYLRIVTPGGCVYRKVRLLDHAVVESAHREYHRAKAGTCAIAELRGPANQAVCNTCAYVEECRAQRVRRQ